MPVIIRNSQTRTSSSPPNSMFAIPSPLPFPSLPTSKPQPHPHTLTAITSPITHSALQIGHVKTFTPFFLSCSFSAQLSIHTLQKVCVHLRTSIDLFLRQTGQVRGEKGGGVLGIPKACLSVQKVLSTLLIWLRREKLRRVVFSKRIWCAFQRALGSLRQVEFVAES